MLAIDADYYLERQILADQHNCYKALRHLILFTDYGKPKLSLGEKEAREMQLYQVQGLPNTEIAELFGCRPQDVTDTIDVWGIGLPRKVKWGPEQAREMLRMKNEGAAWWKIASKFECSEKNVRAVIAKYRKEGCV